MLTYASWVTDMPSKRKIKRRILRWDRWLAHYRMNDPATPSPWGYIKARNGKTRTQNWQMIQAILKGDD